MNKFISLISISCLLASNGVLSVDYNTSSKIKTANKDEEEADRPEHKRRKTDHDFTTFVDKKNTAKKQSEDINTEPKNNSLLTFSASATPKKIWPLTKEWLENFSELACYSRLMKLEKKYFSSSGPIEDPPEASIGIQPANMPRNRWPDVVANDGNYVPVPQKKRPDDYFNGSRIDPKEVLKTDFQFSRKYIAGSAPIMKGPWQSSRGRTPTATDFWQVIWEEKVPVIVNLTGFEDNGLPKSDQYWPNANLEMTFDDISVSNQESTEIGNISVIALSVRKNLENRIIYLIHYTKWPDSDSIRDCPFLITDLIKMIDIMEQAALLGQVAGLKGPIFVHCSAGIRRTGTYVIAAIAKEFIDGTGQEPDLLTMIEKIQALRWGSVGYSSYFSLIHRALKGYLEEGIKNFEE